MQMQLVSLFIFIIFPPICLVSLKALIVLCIYFVLAAIGACT